MSPLRMQGQGPRKFNYFKDLDPRLREEDDGVILDLWVIINASLQNYSVIKAFEGDIKAEFTFGT